MFMKKVRMVAGITFPAMAALATGTAAHAAVLDDAQKAAIAAPALNCGIDSVQSNTSQSGRWKGYIVGQSGCVVYQKAWLTHDQTGVTERVRYVNAAGKFLHTARLNGTISNNQTYFSSYHSMAAYAVWQAAVYNGTSSRITPHASIEEIVP